MLGQLGINESFFVMFGLFVFTYFFVSQVALKKLSATLVEREHRTEGREHDAVHMKQELETVREKVKVSTQAARAQASAEFLTIRNKALEEQRNLVNAARESASAEMKSSRERIQTQMATEVKKLEEDIPRISKAILDKLINSSGPMTSSGSALSSKLES